MRRGRWRWRLAATLVVLLGWCDVALGRASAIEDNGQPATASPATTPRPPLIDLNTATVEQLDGLPGVGRKKAEAIIAQRSKKPFQRVTELLRIKGFGPKLFGRVRPLVSVTANAP